MEKTVYLNSEIARQELAHLSRGKRSKVPVNVLAEYLLNYCAAPSPAKPHDDSVEFCQRLYALEDMRDSRQ
jgi:hypothetical protein